MAASGPPDANEIVVQELTNLLSRIEQMLDGDCLAYFGPISYGADDDIRDAVEDIGTKAPKLIFLLDTDGGFAETVRRISDTIRNHYSIVEFVIPNHAMSAGTILAMSGDAIHMDYYSVLGPIDPQIAGPDGNMMPALGYLVRYEALLEKAEKREASDAEMEILLSFDQGQLYSYEQARDLSRTLLEEWLVKYKFKDWIVTEERKRSVSLEMKRDRARQIADKLSDVKRWNSHGIGINMERLERIVGLQIDDIGKNEDLLKAVRSYHKLMADYMGKMRIVSAVQTRRSYETLIRH